MAPADGKAVAAIENFIGQDIPWMGEPPAVADAVAAPAERRQDANRQPSAERPARTERHEARGGRNGRNNAPRREQPPASVTRIDEARPGRKPLERERPRPEPVESDDDALSHLPAFLLRPVRVKA